MARKVVCGRHIMRFVMFFLILTKWRITVISNFYSYNIS